jgi:transcriptional regulator with XRE-family HTH domain
VDYEAVRLQFAEHLRAIRKERNLTQEELAEMIGKSTEHISFLERGERSPSFEVIIDLAQALNTPVSTLMSLTVVNIETTTQQRLQYALQAIREMQHLGDEYGIRDIFQDNGGKVLQVCILLGLRVSTRREGNDAFDNDGNEYELKTVNRALAKNRGITTHHHLNKVILDKYRAVKAWYIAIYEGIELVEIYRVEPLILEPLFQKWEHEIETKQIALNNPKIPMRYVLQGSKVYSRYPNQTA